MSFSFRHRLSRQCLLVIATVIVLPKDVRSDGLQSGPSPGPFHAGGMLFDASNEVLYLAGLHYNIALDDTNLVGTALDTQSNCYVAKLDLSNGGQFNVFEDWTSLGNAGILETCSSVTLHEPSQIVVVGSVEPGGIPSDTNSSIPLSGMLDVLNKNDLGFLTGLTLTSGSDPQRKLLYPMAAVNDGGGNVFIAALTSTDATIQSNLGDYPNWQQLQKYGTSLDMTVIRIQLTQPTFDGIPSGDIVAEQVWTQEFPIDAETDGTIPRVFIGGLIYKLTLDGRGMLAIAGSTRGKGTGYGMAVGDDEDGFITILDPTSGQLFDGITNNIREGSEKDDIVTGICDDPNDPTSFFIVGATKGSIGTQQVDSNLISGLSSGSLQPFIRQVNVNTLEPLWTNQWAAIPPSGSSTASAAYPMDCYVSGSYVYLAGTVNGGSSMAQGSDVKPSRGGDDVWIARMDKTSGSVEWLTQLGSDGDDSLAPYGCVIVNNQNNPMIYGDTTGSLYRQRGGTDDTAVDMFVMSLDATTGSLLNSDTAFLGGTSSNTPVTAPVAAPVAPVAPPITPAAQPTSPPADHVYTAIGLQITGPAYPGGIVYDDSQNVVLLSGSIFDSSSGNPISMCFTGVVNLDNGDLEGRRMYGSSSLNDGCSAVVFDSVENVGYAVGEAEQGSGTFNEGGSWDEAVSNAAQSGIILQLNSRAEVVGGNRIGNYSAMYPIDVTTDISRQYIYVASMASDSPTSNGLLASSPYPDFTSGGPKEYGSNFFLSMNKFSVESFPTDAAPVGSIPATVGMSWDQRYATSSGTLEVSGLTLAGNGNTIVVVGSTRDGGGAFEENDGDDMDGWILKLNPGTGELFTSESGAGRSSTRLDSVNKKDDWILNVCNDRFDHDAFYLVGASMGKIRDLADDAQLPEGSVHAFVAKVDLEELAALWLKHFIMIVPDGGPVTAQALACTVTPDYEGENIVYVAGTVQNGALMDGVTDITASHGKDDIFIASMDGTSGNVNWIQQIGTSENDRLAAGQGIDVDAYGNAIVYGYTSGNFYSKHEGDSDVSDLVLFTVNKHDGSYLSPTTEGNGVGNDQATEPPDGGTSGTDVGIPESAVALQTGPDVGPSYAGGMVYDKFTNAVYITGSTYGSFAGPGVQPQKTSQCYFGVAYLPRLLWEERSLFGTQETPEACSALSLTNYQGRTEALLVGSTEPSGLLTRLGSGNNVLQYGMILDLSNAAGEYQLLGGSTIDENQVQFPIQILTNEDQVFVVSMASQDTKVTADFEKVENDDFPNFTTGGIVKYGSQFSILVERHTITHADDSNSGVLESTMILDWRKPFETANLAAVYVSGMILADSGGTLVIVGSTRSAEGGDDLDGIMAKVGTADGSFVAESDGARSVAYFSSISGSNDWILNACPDPDDANSFYIVGATEGIVGNDVDKPQGDTTVYALIAKIQTDTLDILWSKEYSVSPGSGSGTPAAARSLGCAVIPGRSRIYVAGNVEGGAVINNPSDPQKSAGNDDIFVSMLETSNGNVVWTKQVGSNGDDRLASGGCIVADENGNAVVFGDTTGALFRPTSGDIDPSYSDLFLMVFNQDDGQYTPPLTGGSGWFGPQDPPPSYTDPAYLAFGITVIVLLVVTFFCFLLVRRSRRKRAESQKSSIFAYLQQFDVEDIDLRKSPPGGWHGTYLNKLAYGINKAEVNGRLPESDGVTVFETAPLTHSSIVKDSLFMDNMSTPSLGYRGDADDYGLASTSSYDDLSPRSNDEKRPSLKGREFI